MFGVLSRNKYDHIIPGISDLKRRAEHKEAYTRAFNTVVTRCFGWGLPCTTMVPFSDCINHHNVDSSYDMIHARWKPLSIKERLERFPDDKICNWRYGSDPKDDPGVFEDPKEAAGGQSQQPGQAVDG